MYLTKEELQEIWRCSLEGEECTIKVDGYQIWADMDSRGYLILHYDDGNETQYLQGKGKWDDSDGQGKFIFLEGIDFEPYSYPYEITLDESELEAVYYGRGQGHLEGWSIETHTDTGDFDAEKGAMTDFEISLYDADGDYVGSGSGHNYYNAPAGVHFYESITFEKPEPDEPPTAIKELDESVINAVQSTSDMKTKIWKMKQLITEYESSL